MLEDILAITENEIRAITDHGKYRTKEDVDLMYKLVDIVKDVYCIKKDTSYPMRARPQNTEFLERLQKLRDEAPDEQTRQTIENMIQHM